MAELGAPGASSATGAPGSGAPGSKEQEAVFKRAWEQMLIDGMDGMTPNMNFDEVMGGAGGTAWGAQAEELNKASKAKGKSAAPTAGAARSVPATGADQDFQKTIKAAMEKLKSSEAGLVSYISPNSHYTMLILLK